VDHRDRHSATRLGGGLLAIGLWLHARAGPYFLFLATEFAAAQIARGSPIQLKPSDELSLRIIDSVLPAVEGLPGFPDRDSASDLLRFD